ncbi:MAG: hypothetical protein PHO37_13945 [Kiritimatiellae bacterium]|nr:hypothetical protein [Kiritimatiellia bacterium]
MRLIKDDQFVRFDTLFRQPCEHLLTYQGVHTHDNPVTVSPNERVAVLGILTTDNTKGQIEQQLQFTLSVADQSGRGHDQHARQQSARDHLTHVKPSHNGLARTRVISQQKPEACMLQHTIINGNTLMREWINA